MICNVKIIKAELKTDLGRGGDAPGLQLVISEANDEWTSCAEFLQETGLCVLKGYGADSVQELVGKWCVVETNELGPCTTVNYVGPFSYERSK